MGKSLSKIATHSQVCILHKPCLMSLHPGKLRIFFAFALKYPCPSSDYFVRIFGNSYLKTQTNIQKISTSPIVTSHCYILFEIFRPLEIVFRWWRGYLRTMGTMDQTSLYARGLYICHIMSEMPCA